LLRNDWLVGSVAVAAIAVSAAPSEAKKKMKPKDGTYAGQVCSTDCGKNNACKVMMWGRQQEVGHCVTCTMAACPAAC
jgi:hypothetical protein